MENCEHKWIPNGIAIKEVWCRDSDQLYSKSHKHGEVAVASCICEKCGEIKKS